MEPISLLWTQVKKFRSSSSTLLNARGPLEHLGRLAQSSKTNLAEFTKNSTTLRTSVKNGFTSRTMSSTLNGARVLMPKPKVLRFQTTESGWQEMTTIRATKAQARKSTGVWASTSTFQMITLRQLQLRHSSLVTQSSRRHNTCLFRAVSLTSYVSKSIHQLSGQAFWIWNKFTSLKTLYLAQASLLWIPPKNKSSSIWRTMVWRARSETCTSRIPMRDHSR